ncbi:hypothetical protein ACFVVC_09520 [Pseudarthrobacter sp. NPDC058196]|uniref:hypothetical protein n=1 Tax=Pseudarthrobacter sp. NPDC058196 TaxID=3346376 RepID=UPI0036DCF682
MTAPPTPRRPRTDGEDPGDLLHRGHLRKRALMHRRLRRKQSMLEPDALRHIPRLHRRQLGLQPGHELQPFQTQLIPPLQHVHVGTGSQANTCISPTAYTVTSARRGLQGMIFQNQHIQGSNRGPNSLHYRRQIRTDSHRDMIQRGTDIKRSRGRQGPVRLPRHIDAPRPSWLG